MALLGALVIAGCGRREHRTTPAGPSRAQIAGWPRTWCALRFTATRSHVRAAMGAPTRTAPDEDDWSGGGYEFTAFYAGPSGIDQLDYYGSGPPRPACARSRKRYARGVARSHLREAVAAANNLCSGYGRTLRTLPAYDRAPALGSARTAATVANAMATDLGELGARPPGVGILIRGYRRVARIAHRLIPAAEAGHTRRIAGLLAQLRSVGLRINGSALARRAPACRAF